jgi:hypothetical protein
MDRVLVTSSNVASVGYDDGTLEVEFSNGSIYQYFAVPRLHFDALTGGGVSVGRYLNAEIKTRYRYEQIS